ncbi:MAG: ABC transporter ATP-binding protein [Chloroflexota bacterium]|nr:ABC transporter ATP-binding protein [Chloroflexota bacterium]MDE2946938.1 ABC transporter ATP-binding protein [Chloroflexota bacterium]
MASASSRSEIDAPSIPLNDSALRVWQRLMRYLGKYRLWVSIAAVGIIGTNILLIVVPYILRDVVDIGIEQGDSAYMLSAGLLVVGLGLMRGLAAFLGRFFGERLSHYVSYDIRNEIYDKVQRQSFSYHDSAQVGTIITRAISDVNEIQRYFNYGLMDGLNVILLLIGVVSIMMASSPLLAIIAFIPLVPLALYSNRFVMRVHPRWKKVMDRMQALSNHIQENALGAEVVRGFAREPYEIERFHKENQNLYNEQLDFITQWITFLPISAALAAMSTALVLLFGGLMEAQGMGNISVGLIVTFNAYVLLLTQPLRFVGFIILLTTQAVASGERIFEVIDEPEAVVNSRAAIKTAVKGHVRFENVSSHYNSSNQAILNQISLEAQPGEVVAIIGLTGSGKTTIANLIPRFYDVTDGRVTIDGIDVRDFDLDSLRSQIGIVMQQSLLFNATIEENIAYGNPAASREQIIEAATSANAHGFISEFPNGYQTAVGERGVTLSGGQKQRIAIARALLIDPRILILDDATSSVDTRTEHLIQQALERIMEGRTTFVIAQRMSTILKADQIIVLRDGEIIQHGSHETLLQDGGLYEEIYKLQLEEQERARREAIIAGIIKVPLEDRRSTQQFRALIDRLAGKYSP